MKVLVDGTKLAAGSVESIVGPLDWWGLIVLELMRLLPADLEDLRKSIGRGERVGAFVRDPDELSVLDEYLVHWICEWSWNWI